MMHMTFYWGIEVTILFDSWKTNSWLSYLLSLFALILLAIFYQFNEQNRLLIKTPSPHAKNLSSATTPLLGSKVSRSSLARFGGAVLFGVNSAIGYFLMLAIMSFNGGVFVAVVLGLAVGYLFFRSDDGGVVVVDNPCACA